MHETEHQHMIHGNPKRHVTKYFSTLRALENSKKEKKKKKC